MCHILYVSFLSETGQSDRKKKTPWPFSICIHCNFNLSPSLPLPSPHPTGFSSRHLYADVCLKRGIIKVVNLHRSSLCLLSPEVRDAKNKYINKNLVFPAHPTKNRASFLLARQGRATEEQVVPLFECFPGLVSKVFNPHFILQPV